MHTCKHDDIGIDGHRLPGECQAVADDIGHAVEDFRGLIVVRQDDGVALAFQRQDGVDVAGEDRPFHRRNDTLHALVKGG